MGTFTTRSVTWLALEPSKEEPPWSFKWIWNIDTMPKIKIFLWQMCHNALPVRGTLLRRGCRVDPLCPLCLRDIESSDHLFSKCSLTRRVWDLAKAHKWIPIQLDSFQRPIGCYLLKRSTIAVIGKRVNVSPSCYRVYGKCEMLQFSSRISS